jgi:NAD-dependent SIR2 family protein deacetylase
MAKPDSAVSSSGEVEPTAGLESLERLGELVSAAGSVFALSGAGCSTGSGIPDYRDGNGEWKRSRPVLFQDFVRSVGVRRRYWARSMVGWARVGRAQPNAAHLALAAMERAGRVRNVVTQNVDGLHQRAGSRRVIDLHGRLDRVECLGCGVSLPRDGFQQEIIARNPGWQTASAGAAPDGDADLEGVDFDGFDVPECRQCGGVLKPSVVFFGENVPRPRVDLAMERLARSDLLLVLGSSLMVWSGYRFVRAAVARGIPVAIINRGRTRGDSECAVKLDADCGEALSVLQEGLCCEQ